MALVSFAEAMARQETHQTVNHKLMIPPGALCIEKRQHIGLSAAAAHRSISHSASFDERKGIHVEKVVLAQRRGIESLLDSPSRTLAISK